MSEDKSEPAVEDVADEDPTEVAGGAGSNTQVNVYSNSAFYSGASVDDF